MPVRIGLSEYECVNGFNKKATRKYGSHKISGTSLAKGIRGDVDN